MKTMLAIIVSAQIFTIAEGANVELAFCMLTNEWGKGSILDFRKKAFQVEPVVVKERGSESLVKWCEDVAALPDMFDENGDTSWMYEKVEMLLAHTMIPTVSTSTNCWLAAAGLLGRYRKMIEEAESNANIKIDFSLAKTDPKRHAKAIAPKSAPENRPRYMLRFGRGDFKNIKLSACFSFCACGIILSV